MCSYTKFTKIKIATKDIVCYKIVRKDKNCCFSFCRDFKYEYDKTYSGKSKLRLFLRWLFNKEVRYEAYHSYVSNVAANVRCIIPKGSLYLINDEGTVYVSTSIKVLKP